MERRHDHPKTPLALDATAELVRLGVVQPPASEVRVLDVAATDGPASTAASDMLALQRRGDTARGE